MIELQWPWMLLLLPLPWLVRLRARDGGGDQGAILVPHFSTLERLSQQLNSLPSLTSRHWARGLLAFLAWLALVLAACQPRMVGDPVPLEPSGRDLMLAVDVSPSMKEEDMLWRGYQTNRLHVVKEVVKEFLEMRQGDRVGLILFGTQPYVQTPLTFDLKTVQTLLDEAALGIAGRATAIGDAITLAVKRLRDRPQQGRVLILLTDGANTAGEVPPLEAAELAAAENIKIYSIGIGADEVLRRGLFGYYRENPSTDLDEDMLRALAERTGGQYFRARSTAELQLVYSAVHELEPVTREQKYYRPVKSLFHWPLAFALGVSAVLVLLRLDWPFRRQARPMRSSEVRP